MWVRHSILVTVLIITMASGAGAGTVVYTDAGDAILFDRLLTGLQNSTPDITYSGSTMTFPTPGSVEATPCFPNIVATGETTLPLNGALSFPDTTNVAPGDWIVTVEFDTATMSEPTSIAEFGISFKPEGESQKLSIIFRLSSNTVSGGGQLTIIARGFQNSDITIPFSVASAGDIVSLQLERSGDTVTARYADLFTVFPQGAFSDVAEADLTNLANTFFSDPNLSTANGRLTLTTFGGNDSPTVPANFSVEEVTLTGSITDTGSLAGGDALPIPDLNPPPTFDTSYITGFGIIIQDAQGNDANEPLIIGSAALHEDFFTLPVIRFVFDDVAGESVLDSASEGETIQTGPLGLAWGGHYEGSTGAVRMTTSGQFLIFDDSDPGSYIYTRFGTPQTPATPTFFADMSNCNDVFLSMSFLRRNDNGGAAQDGEVTVGVLLRDPTGWWMQSLAVVPGIPEGQSLEVLSPFSQTGWTLLDAQATADMDQVDDGGDIDLSDILHPPVTSNIDPRIVQAGDRLVLAAPPGTSHQWKKGGVNVEDDPPRLTGATTRTLIFDLVVEGDAGTYTAVYEPGSKALVTTPEFLVVVLPFGSLPAMGLTGLGLAAGLCAAAGSLALRKTKRPKSRSTSAD